MALHGRNCALPHPEPGTGLTCSEGQLAGGGSVPGSAGIETQSINN